ncbi:phytanoyl-CoA dioxygenase family protein [Streptomyces sp. bgisy153]|uniref:phytanoyl-CoA dioxygenase family protein n=1 Tax=Streptomyces sp. bgisy153 TaxID=3413793 RepID=UPI003D727275
MTDRHAARPAFQAAGWVVLPSIVPETTWCAARTVLYALSRHRSGWRSPKKLHVEDVTGVHPSVNAMVSNPAVTDFARETFAEPVLLGARFRAPLPGYGEQTLHTDDDSGYSGAIRLLTVILPLDLFTARTGATRVLPGIHRDWSAAVPLDPCLPVDGEVCVRAEPGDAIIMSGQLWHSGTRNVSAAPRGAVSLSWIEPSLWSR